MKFAIHRSTRTAWVGAWTTIAIAVAFETPVAHADAMVDGVLNADEGYQLVSTQVHVTSSASAESNGRGGADGQATASNMQSLVQLSNAYAYISSDQMLHLFIGGSIIDNDTKYAIALQTNANGVSNLANQGLQGGLGDIAFDAGFKPNAFLSVTPGISNGFTGTYYPNVAFTDLSKTGKTLDNAEVGSRGNNAFLYTAIGTGQTAHTIGSGNSAYNAPADPGFANVTTGLELSIPLINLGYDGGAVKVIAFPSVGSGTRTDDQILAPFANFSDNTYDYTYIDNYRQFTNDTDYGDDQFFEIPAATPEPGVAALCGLGCTPLL